MTRESMFWVGLPIILVAVIASGGLYLCSYEAKRQEKADRCAPCELHKSETFCVCKGGNMPGVWPGNVNVAIPKKEEDEK